MSLWAMSRSGKIRHIPADESAQARSYRYSTSVCGQIIDNERTTFNADVLFGADAFRKCKNCLHWKENHEQAN